LSGFGEAPRKSVSANFYRVVFKGVDPLSTLGSARSGGRYNSPGFAGVLYTSFASKTGIAEVSKGQIARGINPQSFAADDWWVYEMEVSLDAVLDLTDPATTSQLQISSQSLVQADPAYARQIGKQANDAGFEAMIVPSAARPGEKNLVIFLSAAAPLPTIKSSRPAKLS
jgi:RES domain-containing protein